MGETPHPGPVADLLVVGGGINGVGIARDAAGRGARVVLCEQADLASGTSSASSKLIHGGLRYLEHFEFRLVHESLAEREILLRNAPHLVAPLRFVLPHNEGLRPAWMIRAGLLLYDVLSRRHALQGSEGVKLERHPAGAPLQAQYGRGFLYSDCQVDDSRLVITTALGAARRGATVLPRTRLVEARRVDGVWHATLEDVRNRQRSGIAARILVNVGGPWAGEVLAGRLHVASAHRMQLVKGSHLVLPRLYPEPYAYILQNVDGRVVFVIPYLDRYTLVGTTERPFSGDPATVRIDPDEERYLCEAVNRYLRHRIVPEDAVWRFAGVRPLVGGEAQESSSISRDYVLELDAPEGQAPLLTVFGGKLTTYRRLAEKALHTLRPWLPRIRGTWTHDAILPGGDLPDGPESLQAALQRSRPWLPAGLARRYALAYGTRAEALLADADSEAALGRHFGGGLYEREAAFLVETEWALTADDILWRRSKLGIALPPEAVASLDGWLRERGPALPPLERALARLEAAPAPQAMAGG